MRQYEAMYIVDAELTDEEIQPIIDKYSKVVTDGGGTVSNAAKWEQGRRKLAYEIDRRREGMYLIMHFEAEADVPKELDRVFRISDDVFRHMIVRRDETAPVLPTAPPEAEAAPAAETTQEATEPSAQAGEPEPQPEPEPEVAPEPEPEAQAEPAAEAEGAEPAAE